MCVDSSGDYLSCLIGSAGRQPGPVTQQKRAPCHYRVVRLPPSITSCTLISSLSGSVLSVLVSVNRAVMKRQMLRNEPMVNFGRLQFVGFKLILDGGLIQPTVNCQIVVFHVNGDSLVDRLLCAVG